MRTALLGLVALAACVRKPDAPTAVAERIERADQLVWGAAAMGAIGDFRLANPHLAAVISRADRAVGFAVSGGNLVDLAARPNGEDHLNQLTLYLADEFPRQAEYHKVEIVQARGRTAILRAIGVDNKDPRIAVVTDYILEADARYLTLETRFTRTATATLEGYRPGDAIQWGRSAHLAPGHGFDLPGRRKEVPWVAGLGEDTSYAWVADGPAPTLVMHGSVWSDPIAPAVALVPGIPQVFRRHLVVGTGDVASMSANLARLRRQPAGRLAGQVRHGGAPVEDAIVEVLDSEGVLYGTARVDPRRGYSFDLPPGRYGLAVAAPGRRRVALEGATEIAAGAALTKDFELPARSAIAWRIEGDAGRAEAVRLTFVGLEGTPDPSFGPTFRAAGAKNVVISGRGLGEIPIGVGKYRVLVSRGPEYELVERVVEVREGERATIEGRLVRAYATPGLIAAELHHHAAPSFDSGISLADRALSAAAEGLELIVSTEHNVLVDYRPVIGALGLGRSLASIVGTEATTHSVGHFNAFPMLLDPADARGGMADPEGWTPQAIFDFVRGRSPPGIRALVQVNHPRAGDIGYHDLMRLDPASGEAEDPRLSLDYDALEVVFFGYPDETKQSLEDWYALLRAGARLTATGNSDSHTISGREIGWPRNFVCVDDDTPYRLDVGAFVRALREGCSTVSSGPLVTIRTADARMGGTAKGPVDLEIEVRAAAWISTETLDLLVDGRSIERIPLGREGPTRFTGSRRIACKADCFVLAVVYGTQSMAPVTSDARKRQPLPFAITNPIYVDADGDGAYTRGTR